MLTPVKDEIQGLSKKLGLTSELAFVERAWDSEIGGLAGCARIVAIDQSQLVVEAASSSAMQEMTLRRKELIRRMNKHFAAPLVRGITVRLAKD